MKNLQSLFAFAVLASLVACSATSQMTTKRDFDRKARFDHYKTYAWAPEPKTLAFANPAVEEAIHTALDKDLAARGYSLVKGKTPDFYVVYHVTAIERSDVRHYTDWGFGTTYRPGYGFYVGWPGNPVTYAVLDQYPVGALILDFVEVRRDQLVWRGVASSVMGNNPAQNATSSSEAVHRLLSKFPPPSQPPES